MKYEACNMKHEAQEKSILATLAYYDAFDWPLTVLEIWQQLIRPPEERKSKEKESVPLHEIVSQLEHSVYLKKYVGHKNGFFFLRGRDDLVDERIRAMKISEEKIKKLWRYRWLFLGTPFVKGALVSGSVAGGWAREQSDIDLLVVAQSGRVWSARFFLTLWTSCLGIRRKGNRIKDRVCLNHYLSIDTLSVPFPSLYNAQSYLRLVPFVNRDRAFERFFEANEWIKNYFLQNLALGNSLDSMYTFPSPRFLEKMMQCERVMEERLLDGWLGDAIEGAVKHFQLYFIRRNPLTGKPGGRITAEDWQLEFHPESKEAQILSRYNKTLAKLGLREFSNEPDSGLK